MSYQIVYGPQKRPIKKSNKQSLRTGIITGILLIAVLAALKITGYSHMIRQIILPGDAEVTASAFQNMTDALKNGNGLPQAITAFCETVIKGANIGQ